MAPALHRSALRSWFLSNPREVEGAVRRQLAFGVLAGVAAALGVRRLGPQRKRRLRLRPT
jgi:hypothetical protein